MIIFSVCVIVILFYSQGLMVQGIQLIGFYVNLIIKAQRGETA